MEIFSLGNRNKKYDICTFWEISDTTPQYLSGLFPLRFLFWSGNQIEKFQTCWKSNFKKKLSTLNEAFPGKKCICNFSSQRFVGDTELWGLLEQFPFHSSLWSTSIFSQLRSHMLTRLIPALKWNGAIQKIRYIASFPHKRYCCRTKSSKQCISYLQKHELKNLSDKCKVHSKALRGWSSTSC